MWRRKFGRHISHGAVRLGGHGPLQRVKRRDFPSCLFGRHTAAAVCHRHVGSVLFDAEVLQLHRKGQGHQTVAVVHALIIRHALLRHHLHADHVAAAQRAAHHGEPQAQMRTAKEQRPPKRRPHAPAHHGGHHSQTHLIDSIDIDQHERPETQHAGEAQDVARLAMRRHLSRETHHHR